MKKFKIVNYCLSLLLIFVFTIYGFTSTGLKFITGYFIAGGWQLISMIIHAGNGWFVRRKAGTLYISLFSST